MIVYIDSSVLVRAYLRDEPGHADAVALIRHPANSSVTGSWTRIEVSGALIRAARRGRGVDADSLIASLDEDLSREGLITVVEAPAARVEANALALVREHGLRTLGAWHLATAHLTVHALGEPGEQIAFATRDDEQGAIAEALGFARL